MIQMLNSMMMMANGSVKYGPSSESKIPLVPKVQVKEIFSRPVARQLEARSRQPAHQSLLNKLFVLKVCLSPFNSSQFAGNKNKHLADRSTPVWRLLTCFGNMSLRFHHP